MLILWKIPAGVVLVTRAVTIFALLGTAAFHMASLIAYLSPVACGAVSGVVGSLIGVVNRFVSCGYERISLIGLNGCYDCGDFYVPVYSVYFKDFLFKS